ncbi:4-hydroxy-2-oxo-heptane-1,7-dioate aldolase [Halomonas elongata]|uniref:4-hydroxy-2-oxo-heptane-1,7-dioate aldolase n=1 Tax=Halomonas elongata TaxID=2746 RepID=A0A1B8P0P6_HALEL|nr:4-hydroxy-2-oxo-heptane-1,7-dioate aldolase [Halomonas elongata]
MRLPWNDSVMVKRVLDSGAKTLMFPYIQNAEEARQAVASTRYPGRGFRGVAAVHRASRYGTVKNYLQEAEREIGVILQLETPEAIAALPEIAEVDGIDALFIGPEISLPPWGISVTFATLKCRTPSAKPLLAAGLMDFPVESLAPIRRW